MDWTNAEYLANIAAEELAKSLERQGIRALAVTSDDEGGVTVILPGLPEASAMLTLGVRQSEERRSLYDRVTSSCLTLGDLSAVDGDTEDAQDAAMDAGWTWMIHPNMSGRAVSWHVMVSIRDAADAATFAANLNARGGAL